MLFLIAGGVVLGLCIYNVLVTGTISDFIILGLITIVACCLFI